MFYAQPIRGHAGFAGLDDYLFKDSTCDAEFAVMDSYGSIQRNVDAVTRKIVSNGFGILSVGATPNGAAFTWDYSAGEPYRVRVVFQTPVDFAREQDARDRIWQLMQQVWPDASLFSFDVSHRASGPDQDWGDAFPDEKPAQAAKRNNAPPSSYDFSQMDKLLQDVNALNRQTAALTAGQNPSATAASGKGFDLLKTLGIDAKTAALGALVLVGIVVLAKR
jgi:hypothetical protein